jgi:hypothetical protein
MRAIDSVIQISFTRYAGSLKNGWIDYPALTHWALFLRPLSRAPLDAFALPDSLSSLHWVMLLHQMVIANQFSRDEKSQ